MYSDRSQYEEKRHPLRLQLVMAVGSYIARKHKKQKAANDGTARGRACEEQHDFWKNVVSLALKLLLIRFTLEPN